MQESAGACLPEWQFFGAGNLQGLRFMGGSLIRMVGVQGIMLDA